MWLETPYVFQTVNLKISFMNKLICSLLLLFLCNCAPTHIVKPIAHHQHLVSGSLGGPIVEVPHTATIPIPFTSVGYAYGLKPKTTIHSRIYPTSLAFGVLQLDLGCTQNILTKNKWSFQCSPTFNVMFDMYEKVGKFWPMIDINTAWDYHKENYFYFGINNWFELGQQKAHKQVQTNHWIFSPQIGHVFKKNKWEYQLEVKVIAPNKSNENIVLNYTSILGNKGALGTYLGIRYNF
jgi:hypothetical protein